MQKYIHHFLLQTIKDLFLNGQNSVSDNYPLALIGGMDPLLIGVIIGMLRGTYSQMETINRLVGLPLREAPLWGFQIPQGDDVQEGILLSAFLCDGVDL